MNKKTIVMMIGTIIALLGIVFSSLSHEWHNAILGNFVPHEHPTNSEVEHEHGSHESHRIYGITTFLVGLSISFIGWKIID